MNFDHTAVWFGMSKTGRPSRRYPPARLTAKSAVLGRTTSTGSECHSTANQAIGARADKRNAQPKRRRSSVMAIAFLAVLLPFGAVAGSEPWVWPGRTTITVRDYTSDTFDGIVQKEVAAWSAIMPGRTTLKYVDGGPRDCSAIGDFETNRVASGEIWICSTASVAGNDIWGQGFMYARNGLIVRGYALIEEGGPRSAFERYHLVCHELGHTLGLGHRTGRRTCMTPAHSGTRKFPGRKDKVTLAKRYKAAGSP